MNKHQLTQIVRLLTRGRSYRGRGVALIVILFMMGYGYVEPIIEKQFGISLPSLSGNQSGSAPPSQRPNGSHSGHSNTQASNTQTRTGAAVSVGEQAVLDAFESRQSDLIIEFDADVKKNLADDNVGSRHQKMILRLPSGHTLLLAHNIDLAKRVPAQEGDTIRIKGEYEYSEQGGVIHWTHHDPGGRHENGWIEFNGQRYE